MTPTNDGAMCHVCATEVLDFTNKNKASNVKKGYFKQWNELIGGTGEYNPSLNYTDDVYYLEKSLTGAKATKGNK